MKKKIIAVLLCLPMLSLTGCSGGGGAGSASTNSTSLTNSGASSGVSSGTSSGGGEVTAVAGGVVADPYIKGATFFEDANGNGQWDPGEQVSTASDDNGQFYFTNSVPAGHTIIMLNSGSHQSLPFATTLSRQVVAGDSAIVTVSPLTTLVALGFTADQIHDLLYPLTNDDSYDVNANPMTGLDKILAGDNASDAALAPLRANLYVGAVLELARLNQSYASLTSQDVENLLQQSFLTNLMQGVRYAVSTDAIGRISAKLPSGYTNLPAVTMQQVAESMPEILNWWEQSIIGQELAGSTLSMTAQDFEKEVDTAQPALGLACYALDHQDNQTVKTDITQDNVALNEDGTVNTNGRTMERELLVGQPFSVGDVQIQFYKGSTTTSGVAELTYTNTDGSTAQMSGTWSIDGTDLVVQGDDSTASLDLALEAGDTSPTSHLFLVTDEDGQQTAYAPTSFLGRLVSAAGQFKLTGV